MDAQQQFKQAAAESAVALVEDGMILGLGHRFHGEAGCGCAGQARNRRAAHHRHPDVGATAAAGAGRWAFPFLRSTSIRKSDLTIDGADEVELGTLNLIKGRGGALLREKDCGQLQQRLVIIADETKLVDRLGAHFAVPVEAGAVWLASRRRASCEALGAKTTLRPGADGKPFITDGGNFIVDCLFGPIAVARGAGVRN